MYRPVSESQSPPGSQPLNQFRPGIGASGAIGAWCGQSSRLVTLAEVMPAPR